MQQHLNLSIGIHVLNKVCETLHMEQRKSQNEVLDDLVAQGTITEQQASEIADAPQWSFSVRELVTYLAALIIAVGVIRILAIAFQDASENVIVISLYVVSALTGITSWKLSSSKGIRKRFGEVFELGSLGSALGATGVLLSHTELRGEAIGLILMGVSAAWGIFRCRDAQFAGTAAMCVGVNGVAISLGALIDSNRAWAAGGLMVLSGSFLIYMGTSKIGVPYFARAVGALFVVIGSMTLGTDVANGRVIPILAGIALFAVGAMLLMPELLIAGAFCIVIGIVMTVTRWINNDMAQGLVIIGTGVVMLIVLSAQMKRISNRLAPGIPAA
jgi:hypothetical protein